jgi:acetyl esterase
MMDLQVESLLELARGLPEPDYARLDPLQMRKVYAEGRAAQQPERPELASSRDLVVAGPHGPLTLRVMRPKAAPDNAVPGALVYFHGGGWVLGSIDTHDTLCRLLADRSGQCVISVDYRLSPEHKFPVALEECLFAANWVVSQGRTLGIDTSRVGIGGDSAGGNLAAVVALLARNSERSNLRFQLLLYPAADMAFDAPSHTRNGRGFLLTHDMMLWFREQYLPPDTDLQDWRVSPLRATDLSRLPSTLILSAGLDPLRDEGVAYAKALASAGVAVEHHCFEGMLHGFCNMGGVLDEAHRAFDLAGLALRAALS